MYINGLRMFVLYLFFSFCVLSLYSSSCLSSPPPSLSLSLSVTRISVSVTRMDTLLEHVVKLAQYKSLSCIDTGDRVMDSTLGVISSTIITHTTQIVRKGVKRLVDITHDRFYGKKQKVSDSIQPSVLGSILTEEDIKTEPEMPENCIEVCLTPIMSKYVSMWTRNTYSTRDIYSDSGSKFRVNLLSFHEILDRSKEVEERFWNLPIWKFGSDLLYLTSASGSNHKGVLFLKSKHLETAKSFLKQFEKFDEEVAAKELEMSKAITTVVKTRKTMYTFDLMHWYRRSIRCDDYDQSSVNYRWTFDSMVFEEKSMVVDALDSFVKNISSDDPFASRKFGMLIHGKAGVGKSSIIQAVANMLQRSVATVDLSNIDDKLEFKQAIDLATSKNVIIVFDELDRLLEAMKRNSTSEKEIERQAKLATLKKQMDDIKDLDSAAYEVVKKVYLASMSEKFAPMDEAFLLTLLDGISDSSNRIIIASTNHPDKIELPFKRPGRLGDFVLNFTNFKRKQVADLLTIIYKPTDTSDIDALSAAAFTDYLWSPSEIVNVHRIHRNLNATMKHLLEKIPMTDLIVKDMIV